MSDVAQLKFLVVDDSPTMRRIVLKALRSYGVESLIEAADGREGAEKILTTMPDFVITDWNMPNMSGLDLVRWIRSNAITRHLPVLMVTTRDNKEDVIDAVQARVNNYIVKPFTPVALRERIQAILDGIAASNASTPAVS